MISYSFTGLIGTGIPAFSTNVTDLEVAWIDGAPRLYSANLPGPGAGYAAYDISAPGTPATLLAVQGYSAPVHHLSTPDFLVLPGQGGAPGNLIAAGVTPSGWASYHLTGGGGLAAPLDTPFSFNPVAVAGLASGGANFVYFATAGAATPLAFRLADSGAFTPAGPATPTPGGSTQDDLAVARTDGGNYLLSVSAAGNTIASHAIAANGSLSLAGQVDAQAGTGFSKPTEVAALTVLGQSFAVVAAQESSSLSVFRILPGGTLYHADHVVDGLATRFAGATALATLQIGDRGYVAVGGADGGVEVMTLLPDGRLIDLLTIADDAAMSLDHVSALSLAQVNGRTSLFAASATEPGLTQIELNLGTPGVTLWQQAGAVLGGAGDDLLAAGAATTEIRGGAGDDLIVGGGAGGAALLYGGAGADRFILSASAQTIRIMDYQPGIDRLDLSSLPMLRNLGQMTIATTATGADLTFGTATIHIESFDGNPIPVTAFAEAQMLALTRYAPVAQTDVRAGTAGNDVMAAPDAGAMLLGLAGHDWLAGGAGDDLLDSGAGNDTLAGGDGGDRLLGGAGDDLLSGGGGNDWLDGGDGRDSLGGDAGNDTLSGGLGDDVLTDLWGDNTLDGGGGNDRLLSGAGNDAMAGGAGNDYIVGDTGDDMLWGGTGDDLLGGGAGNDVIQGEDGNDTLYGAAGDDGLYGGVGNDQLWAGDGNDSLDGGAGNDLMDGGAGNDSLDGGGGNDRISAGAGDDLVTCGTGNDYAVGQDGNDTLWGGAGADTLGGSAGNDVVHGEDGNDLFYGSFGDDALWGENGNDLLYGHSGNDSLDGGFGNDTLWGGDGDDLARAGTGNDQLFGEAGNDALWGGAGNDLLGGGDGSDTVHGEDGNDTLFGGLGDDQVWGENGNDWLIDGAGNDSLYGGAGNDTLAGGDGLNLLDGGDGNDSVAGGANADSILGGNGDDTITAGGGNDTISAGAGNDLIRGGTGADTCYGGGGADRFVFASAAEIGLWASADHIEDFTPGQDRISLAGMGLHFAGARSSGAAHELRYTLSGGDMILHADLNGDGAADFTLYLHDVTAISASDFIF